jgi:AcrR family transcriptional regulator
VSPRPKAPARARYHHGSLRRALLDAALALIEQHGTAGLSLRAAARAAGVSAGAPYHHFQDKSALIAELAEEGFAMLHQALTEAGKTTEDPAERAFVLARAYVRFAVEQPTRFRLMMGRAAQSAGPSESARRAYELMRRAVVAKGRRIDPALVLASWSLVHGLSFLAIDGHLAGPGASWEACRQLVEETLRAGPADQR